MCWESCVEAGFFNCFSGLVDHSGREDGKSARDEGRVQGMIEGVQGIMGKVQGRMGREQGMIGGTVLVNANMKCISSCQEALSLSFLFSTAFPLSHFAPSIH